MTRVCKIQRFNVFMNNRIQSDRSRLMNGGPMNFAKRNQTSPHSGTHALIRIIIAGEPSRTSFFLSLSLSQSLSLLNFNKSQPHLDISLLTIIKESALK